MKAARGLDKALFAKLVAGDWIARHQNLLIMRPDRHRQKLACLCARPQGLPRRPLRPLSSRATAVRCPGACTRRRPSCTAPQEPGTRRAADPRRLGPRHPHPEQGRDILEIVDDRHSRGSTIVTSQLPVDHWHEAIANPTIADAILDRLVHNAHRLTLKGESMRKTAAKRAGLDVKQDA